MQYAIVNAKGEGVGIVEVTSDSEVLTNPKRDAKGNDMPNTGGKPYLPLRVTLQTGSGTFSGTSSAFKAGIAKSAAGKPDKVLGKAISFS